MRLGLQSLGLHAQTEGSGQSSMEPVYDINNPDKKNAWKMIQGMISRGQHNDAFAIALNVFEEDELPLIKTLSKLKCKSFLQLPNFFSL